jgi:hypothetical protein
MQPASHEDEFIQFLFGQIRLGKRFLLPGITDLIALTSRSRPFRFDLWACLQLGVVPCVIQVPRRHPTKEENVITFSRECQAEALNAIAWQITFGQRRG